MKFFILTIFCNLLSSGHLQVTNNADDYNLIQADAGKSSGNDWPLQTFHTIQGNFYGQAQRNIIPKPCSRRSNSESEPIEQQLSPPLASKVEPLTNIAVTLKPQALRNEEYDLKTTDNQEPLTTPPLKIDVNNLYKTRNSLPVSNPVIDSFEENHREVIIPINNKEILEDNPKPSDQLRFAPISDSQTASNSVVHPAASRSFQSPASAFRYETTNEYSKEPEKQNMAVQSNAIGPNSNQFRSTKTNTPSTTKSDYFPEFTGDFHPLQEQSLPSGPVTKHHVEPEGTASTLPNKCSHDKEPNDLIGHSRRSMSSYNDDDNAKDMLSYDKDLHQNKDDPYIESHIDNENAMAAVLNVEKNAVKSNKEKDQGLKSLDKSKLPGLEKPVSRGGRPQFNDARREMIEPTKGSGITNMGQSSVMLMQTERICYACSTANNPSCWAPDRRTTVKYCRKGNNACITKTFGKGSTFTLIRDCGKSCDDSDMGGLTPRYKSCSMCHSELCNGAYSINGHSIIFALILIALVKYLN